MSCLMAPRSRCLSLAACALLALVVGVTAPATQAQNRDARPLLTLPQAIGRTLERHPSLSVFDYRQRSLDGRAQTANLRPALNLDTELENFAGTDGAENTEFTVGLSSVFELGGKRNARGDVVASERQLLNLEREIQALDLFGEVTRRYVQLLSVTEQLALAKDAVQLADSALVSVATRVRAGAAPSADQLRASAALSRAQLQQQQLEKQWQVERVALSSMWGETDGRFSVAGEQLYRLPPADDFQTYLARAHQNPLLMRFASEARVQEARLRLANSAARADVRWGLGVRQSNETDSTSLVAGFSMPLFSGRRAQGEVISARAALQGTGAREEVARLQLHTQLYRAYAERLQAVQSARRLREEIIPALTRAMSETETLYRAGRYTYQDWVAAREELLDARRSMIDSATRALLAGAEMEQLTAAPLVDNGGRSATVPGNEK